MDIIDLGKTPIPGPAPAGEDARYDAEYADLQAEIGKLTSISQTEPVAWPHVVELATGLLSTRSKDLQAAAYLAVGLMQVQGLVGLAQGARVLRDLMATFWQACFPPLKRLHGRINALNWWRDETAKWLDAHPPAEPLAAGLHQDLMETVQDLDRTAADLLPDLGPLHDLIDRLKRLPVEQPPEPVVPAAPAAPSPSLAEPTATAPAPAGPAPTLPPADLEAARKALAEAALSFSNLALAAGLADPWAWKASRVGAWIGIAESPPNQGGQTLIPAPDTEIKSALLAQINTGGFAEAARTAEEHFTGSVLWFDLQRLIDMALTGLGADYAAARAAVHSELLGLLGRLPGLELLAYADGTPFADPETRAWIADLQTASGPGQGSGRGGDPVAKAIGQAQQQFATDDRGGALDLLSDAIRQATDGAAQLRLRHAQMGLLSQANRFDLAAALADDLIDAVESRALAAWQPDLAVDLLLGCHQALSGAGTEEALAKARALILTIGRIRPSAAMNLSPEPLT